MKEDFKILDCGCGIGRWTNQLINRFPDAEITALDHKRRLPRIKGVQFIKGSVEKLPFQDNEFDLIIVSRVLPYVDMKIAIEELERVTKDEGVIVYELMQVGYYLQRLLRGQLKRIANFINWWLYIGIESKLFKSCDNIDSWITLRFFSNYKIAERYPLKSWGFFSMYSLIFMTSRGEIYKKRLYNKIKKIAREVLSEET